MLHVIVAEGNAAARALRRGAAAVAVNVNFTAQARMLRRHPAGLQGVENLPMLLGADQAGRQAALRMLGVGVADAQRKKVPAARVLLSDVEVPERGRLIALD